MKKLALALVLVPFLAGASFATTVDGCEIKPSAQGGFSIKVDPTCKFDSETVQDDFTKDLSDFDR